MGEYTLRTCSADIDLTDSALTGVAPTEASLRSSSHSYIAAVKSVWA